jgi:hypothetical protein
MMREQTGQVFHKGKSWFVRYCDDVMQPDGTIKRKRVCKKLSVDFCDEYRTRKSVQSFVDEILAPVNGGLLNPQSTMPVTEFVEKVYLPEHVEKQLRAATLKQYRDVWEDHLKGPNGQTDTARIPHGSRRAVARSDCGSNVPRAQFSQAHQSLPVWRIQGRDSRPMLGRLRRPDIERSPFVLEQRRERAKDESKQGPHSSSQQLAEALEKHKLRIGKLAQPNMPIFQAGNGKPLNLDNLVRRVIVPALTRCEVCGKAESGHANAEHEFKLDTSIPSWHGWHSFRRGLATNL